MGERVFHFEPDQVAYFEVEGWKAYYDHAWIRLLRLIIALVQAQFSIPFPQSWRAAYFVTRASAAWAPKDHDMGEIEPHLRSFYALARRYSGLKFDVNAVAALELRYWDAHRRLVGSDDKTEFLEAMIALHAALFGLSGEQARESAELRVEANNVLDTITGGTSRDPAADWQRCQSLLQRCYRSLQAAAQP
ncbi:MAG: hypothetical protein JNL42_01380 [Anaerolineae bacterium]|nr:hypothetical protein [Anaerolineae bacterium]